MTAEMHMEVSSMRNTLHRLCLAAIIVITVLLLVFPSPAKADGGPVLSDPELWAQLKEGQQTAVVTLKGNNTVDVDLFVSLLDESGQSHEVVFFVPLGTDPTAFSVIERTSLDFDQELTEGLDEALRKEVQSKRDIGLSLLSATLLINGGWMSPIGFALLLSGCAAAPAPEATYETDSSRVDIYGLDEDTDLEALINTTGLDSSVEETLSRLRGQRIAIVTLQTQPPLPGGDSSYHPVGQPGIHLAWTTELASQSAGAVYSYPLGTGSAWAHPIELTRVYVVAPLGIDFTVQYPTLGTDHSGFTRPVFGNPVPRIIRYYHTSAYAVDEARGNFGHIWRATYTQSNSAEDIVITTGSSAGFLTTLRRVLVGWGIVPNLLVELLMALVVWVIVWRYIVPRMLGTEYRWRGSRLWRDSLIYPGINAVLLAGGAGIVGAFFLSPIRYLAIIPGLIVAVLIVLPVLFAVPGVIYLLKRHVRSLGISKSQALTAYIVVILIANLAYLALAFGYAALIGVI